MILGSRVPRLALALLMVVALGGYAAYAWTASSARATVGTGVGLVSASHPRAAEAGAEILRRGGNAVDAAAAVQFALNVVEPQSSGIGGGGFMMIYLVRTGQTMVLDGREAAPSASTPDQFLGPDGRPITFDEAHVRGTAVGVPGTVMQVVTALERFGTLSLSETLEPAVELAEGGFRVNRFLAQDIARTEGKLGSWPASAAVFLPGGEPLGEGAVLRQPDLAATFRLLQQQGPAVFYTGEIGQAIVTTQLARGGRMTLADLADYRVKDRAPVVGQFRGHQIVSSPPPSSGGLTMQQMLQLLEPLELRSKGANTTLSLHLMIEAMHLAYADRGRYMGDPDFTDVPSLGLLAPAYVDLRRALIKPNQANPEPRAGDPFAYQGTAGRSTPAAALVEEGLHTTHLTVVDGDGNVVSFTTTIESLWGSGIVVPGYGFLLNNELTDFAFMPGGPNQVEPGKRPRSSMTPTIVFRDGRPVLALGSPGGGTIITTVMQVLLNVVEHGMQLQDAIDAGRIASPSFPEVEWEANVGRAAGEGLRALGHAPREASEPIGSVQAALRRPDGAWVGGADRRREGTVVYVETRPSEPDQSRR